MSFDLHSLILFIITSFILVIMPGPNILYVVTRGITQGRKAALISALGASAGDLLYAVSAAFGLGLILQASATAYGIVKTCGALYMLYIGVQTFRKEAIMAEHTELQKEEKNRALFMKGFLTAALNPKTAIFFVSFLPQFIDANSESAALSMLLYGVIFFLLGLIVLISYAQASSFVRQWLAARKKADRCFRWLTGTLFIGLGIKLIVPEHR